MQALKIQVLIHSIYARYYWPDIIGLKAVYKGEYMYEYLNLSGFLSQQPYGISAVCGCFRRQALNSNPKIAAFRALNGSKSPIKPLLLTCC